MRESHNQLTAGPYAQEKEQTYCLLFVMRGKWTQTSCSRQFIFIFLPKVVQALHLNNKLTILTHMSLYVKKFLFSFLLSMCQCIAV